MKLTAHQAIYGEKNRGHSLICSSLPEEKLPQKLVYSTDRPSGNLPPNVKWEPYFSGYPFDSYYIISKTFPDLEAPRSGMVLTHAILLNLDDAIQLNDLQTVLQLLPIELEKRASVSTLEIITAEVAPPQALPPGFSKLVNALLSQNESGRPVVWVGQDGFIEVIQCLWRNLWPAARRTLRFRLSFGQQDVQDESLTLVSTPTALVNKWSGYVLVRKSDTHTPETKAEAFLLGLPDGEPLHRLQEELKLSVPQISAVRQLELCYDYFQPLRESNNVDRVRLLVRTLGTLSPNPSCGVQRKKEALSRLVELTKKGSPKDIKALRNLNVTPFIDGAESLRNAIATWVKGHFQIESSKKPEEIADLVTLSFSSDSIEWNEAIQEGLREILLTWKADTGLYVWNWWQVDSKLVERLDSYIPNKPAVEKELVRYCPTQLSSEPGEKVREFCAKRQWYILHAATVAALYEPEVALQEHLKLDKKLTYNDALYELSKRIPGELLVQAALNLKDERLLQLAGEACTKEPLLLNKLNVKKKEWRKIWFIAIHISPDPWTGISKPKEITFSMMDLLLKGEEIESELLIRLADSPYGDLTDYPKRKEIWGRMKPEVSHAYLNVTANGWLEKFRKGEADASIEEPLEKAIFDSSQLKTEFIKDISDSISFAIRLFSRFPKLTERDFNDWVLDPYLKFSKHMDKTDSLQIGEIVQQKYWSSTASRLYEYARYRGRKDLMPAVNECQRLLSWYQRLSFSWFVNPNDYRVSKNDWWEAFTEIAIELYPRGLEDQEIWSRAGGDISAVSVNLSAKASWETALRKLRQGGGGQQINVEGLIGEMKNDFPNNLKLVDLHELLQKFEFSV